MPATGTSHPLHYILLEVERLGSSSFPVLSPFFPRSFSVSKRTRTHTHTHAHAYTYRAYSLFSSYQSPVESSTRPRTGSARPTRSKAMPCGNPSSAWIPSRVATQP
jgi:hypothetical protein